MTTSTRVALAELGLYALALWLSYELARTAEDRRESRLKAYITVAQLLRVTAYFAGRGAMRAELAYWNEVHA